MEEKDVVVLSHHIIPGQEHFKLETSVDDVTNILPEVKHRPDVWYILGEVTYCTHVGTHIEVPYHHLKEGADVAEFPVHILIGNCVVLDFSHKKHRETITIDELDKYDQLIQKEDIVFIRTDMDKYFRTPRWNEQPYLTEEANLRLIDKEIACLGTDSAGLEVPDTDYQPNHQTIFKANIPMIESLTNLDKIENGKYNVVILPLPIEGLEASPLQVVAVRKGALE